MAMCPRCRLSVPAFSRCDHCGLMLGYNGLTVLIECDESGALERARTLAQRQPSCREYQEESGRRYLRVTYKFSELDEYNRLVTAAAGLPRKHAFINGLEVPWTRLRARQLPGNSSRSRGRAANRRRSLEA
ncbi:MAG TPA: hypothetical protein VNK82_06880 [Terriglobales bacterium]|nr:hypothetical protein [Terriglobales bacterium]